MNCELVSHYHARLKYNSIMKAVLILSLLITTIDSALSAYSIPTSSSLSLQKGNRKAFFSYCASAVASVSLLSSDPEISIAFDGSGSTAYSGRNPTSKAELKRSYQNRIVEDVKDFKRLGAAIDNGDLSPESSVWVSFFIEFQRREADDVGRTYAALADLVGTKDVSGCGLLLATSYGKPGKPADNLPSVKKFNAMAKLFDPIKAAGKKGDAAKVKSAWTKAGAALSEYLEAVELPPSLSDPIYD